MTLLKNAKEEIINVTAFDRDREGLPTYNLVLMKMNEERIADITKTVEDFSITKNIAGVSEIRFVVYRMIEDKTGKKIRNPHYDLLQGDTLINLNNMDYFIVRTPIETADDNGFAIKEIVAYSREYELVDKILNMYEGDSRVIYDYANEKDENDVHKGFFNYVEEKTAWRVEYVNSKLLKKYRYLSFNNTNILQSIKDIQKIFGALIRFDTVNRKISILDVEQVGTDQGLYISDKNFISELRRDINHDDIVTKLYLYGKDNLSIHKYNITGQPYIVDFSFYMNEDYMSRELIDKLKEYNEHINEKDGVFKKYLEELETIEDEQFEVQRDVRAINQEIRLLEHDFDIAIAEGSDIKGIQEDIKKKEEELDKTHERLKNIQQEIRSINQKISELGKDVDIESFLSDEQIRELNYFIKEERFQDNHYGEHNIDELYEDGLDMLKEMSQPALEFDISVYDFLQVAEAKSMWNKLILGDIVHIENFVLENVIQVRLIEYTHSPSEDSLTLKFSSKKGIYDNQVLLEDILENASNASKAIDFNKFKWDKGETVQNDFSDWINSSLDLSKQEVAKADGQIPILDDRGLWLTKEYPDGTVSPEQIRAINNVIAVTKDNWNTVDVAITPDGVMATKLIGDIILGTDLKIISNNGVVEILENLLTIRDDKGRIRVQLGEYQDGKFGLRLRDKEGRNTVLDEDGMLQVWQEGNVDNTDNRNPLDLHIYIPENVRHIYNAKLRVRREVFRSYSDTTDSERIRLRSTEVEDGYYETSYEGEDKRGYITIAGPIDRERSNTSEPTEVDSRDMRADPEGRGDGLHDHGIPDYERIALYDGGFIRWVPSGAHTHKGHTHEIHVPYHTHEVDVSAHVHEVYIPSHSHEIVMPSHRHEIEPVIAKSGGYPSYRIYINGTNRTSDFTSGSWIHSNRSDLDITRRLEKGKWNTVSIHTDGLGRIDATVFVQCMLNFDGLN